jgi:hypothetical protein
MIGLTVEFSTSVKARITIGNCSYNARPCLLPVVLTKQNRIEGYCILGCDAVLSGKRSSMFQNNHAVCVLLVACLAYSLPLKMDVVRSPETSVNYRTVRCQNPEHNTTLKFLDISVG